MNSSFVFWVKSINKNNFSSVILLSNLACLGRVVSIFLAFEIVIVARGVEERARGKLGRIGRQDEDGVKGVREPSSGRSSSRTGIADKRGEYRTMLDP